MKTLSLAVIFASLILTGCQSTFIEKEFNKEEQWLKVKVARTEASEFSRKEGFKRKGKAGEAKYYLNDPENECRINIMSKGKINLDGKYALTLGHELMHCLYGDYHK